MTSASPALAQAGASLENGRRLCVPWTYLHARQ
jgi:Calcium binding